MKKLFSLLFVALLSMTAWGTTVTFVPGNPSGGYSNASQADQMSKDGVTISSTKAAFGRTDNYRFAKDSETTITSTVGNITKVEITSTATYDAQYGPYGFDGTVGYTCQSGSKIGTWQGDAASLTLVAAVGQVRATQIVVTIADPVVTTLQDPVFDPEDGTTFTGGLQVTVSCPTQNATMSIYKVVDGEIDWSSYQYAYESTVLTISETTTFTAQAYLGEEESNWVTATFTKVDPVTEIDAPTFDPADGTTFDNELVVTITGPEGSTIYYMVNDSPEYEVLSPATVTLTETSTIMAYAELDGVESDIVEASYTKNEVTPPEPWQGTETYLSNRDKGNYTGTVAMNDIVISKESRPGVSFTISRGMAADNGYRIYKNETITFNSQVGNITAIEFVGVQDYAVSNFGEVEGMTYDGNNGVWVGNAATVTFTAVTAQVRATEIRITIGQEAIIVNAPVITPENNTVFAGEQEVTITCSTEGAEIYYTINDGDETLYEGPFTVDATSIIKAYAKKGDTQSAEVSAKFILGTEISAITDGNTAGEYYIYNGEAVVTYQNGSYTWIRDNSGSGLIYGYQVPTLNQGDVLEAGWTANYTVYKNVPEFQYPMGVQASGNTATVEPFEREAVTTANVNEYVVLKGITVLTDETNTKKFYNAADSLILYNQFNIADSVLNIENGKTYDVEGIVYIFNETVLELYITKVTEVAAQEWALGDVNHDTYVNVADVTAMIKYILTSGEEPEEFYRDQANVDGDAEGTINVADVTALIQLVLNGGSN
jgi:hypothetical protein